MGAVAGQGTTFTLPNYHGELFVVTPTETPFLSAIGGLNAAKACHATQFEWQTVDRRASSSNNAALEGANAPAGTERSRSNLKNVVEIHHSAIDISYSKLAATRQFAGANIGQEWDDAYAEELGFQTIAELESMAVDLEQSFLTGTLQIPVDNTTPRKTQGVLGIAATVNANGGTPRALSKLIVDATLKAAFDAGAKLPQDSTVFVVGSAQKVALTNAYSTPALNQVPFQRTIGGVAIDTIVTDFGTFGVMLDRWMPATKLGILDLSVCYPTFMEIPGKGILFTEELARTGSSRKFQLYGEIGLEYGPLNAHALVKDLL
jgi:Family of unknown function (DUF5309)